jgi:peptidoglycan/xylan/chitin deacetylase (PgdA/CDA1 family)
MNKLIVTTSWDDGSKFDLKTADLLRKYGLTGTFYVPRFYLDNPLTEKEVIALDKHFEIGSHTLNHAELTNIPLSEVKKEIQGSKDYLEDLLGHNISMLCYPKGLYNSAIINIVKDCKYVAARTTNPGTITLSGDPYEWPITLDASNGSPRLSFFIWLRNRIAVRSLFDWEIRAKQLFDRALNTGGIYHLWGHSAGYERRNEWSKLERVFAHISKHKNVKYSTNGEIFRTVNE